MSRPKHADFEGLVRHLRAAHVDFVIVGGAAAILLGAPTSTLDLDIVPRATEENLLRLVDAVRALDAVIRDPAGRELRPDLDLLRSGGQVQLSTTLGPLDVLMRLHDGRAYDDLEPSSIVLSDEGVDLRVIDLETLIAIKESTGRAKDRLLVPLLWALRDESENDD